MSSAFCVVFAVWRAEDPRVRKSLVAILFICLLTINLCPLSPLLPFTHLHKYTEASSNPTTYHEIYVADSVSFYSRDTAPEAYRDRSGVDFETAMYAFRDGESYAGYYAFRELFRHFRALYPVAVCLSLPVVRTAGERLYACIAADRDRHFAYSVDADADE